VTQLQMARVVALAFLSLCTTAWGEAEPAAPSQVTLFTHVNVVPMDRDHVLRDQSVLVTGDTIKAVGKNIPVPPAAHVVDGHGTEFLSPGLADMRRPKRVRSSSSPRPMAMTSSRYTTIFHPGVFKP